MIVACIGYFVLDIFVDGVFQDPFAKTVVYIFERIGMDELEAIRVYRLIFVQNKTMIIGAGFFLLLLLSFYLGMSKFTTYLKQVESGIQMILNESKDHILLPPELNPLENKLNEIKGTLKEQRRIAEESEQRKNDIIVYLAHDLKTPLTSIIGYVDLLSRDQTLSAESRDYVTILINKTERLKSIISDLFELAKATSGDAKVDLEEMDMKRLVEQTLGDMADQIEESGFAIRYQCEATHTRFIGDSSRMYRVVQNVIENALKYSLKGTRIFLRITEADQNIKLEVINTASYEMNFTEEEIMERFARAEKSRTSEGNGLGLSIADSFTKNCGGEFSIRIDGDQFLVTIQFKQHLDVNK